MFALSKIEFNLKDKKSYKNVKFIQVVFYLQGVLSLAPINWRFKDRQKDRQRDRQTDRPTDKVIRSPS